MFFRLFNDLFYFTVDSDSKEKQNFAELNVSSSTKISPAKKVKRDVTYIDVNHLFIYLHLKKRGIGKTVDNAFVHY